jgi:hypothetical protein
MVANSNLANHARLASSYVNEYTGSSYVGLISPLESDAEVIAFI